MEKSLHSNSTTQSMPRKAPSALKLTALLMLLVVVTTTIWLLSSSNVINSNSKLAAIENNFDRSIKQLWNKFNNFGKQGHIVSKQIESAAISPIVYKFSDPNAVINIEQIAPAIDALKSQVGKGKSDPSYHNRLGILYAQIGDFTNAIQHLNQAVSLGRAQLISASIKSENSLKSALVSDNSAIYVQLGCAHSNLARIYDKLGDHKQVLAELDELNKDIIFAGDIPNSTSTNKKASNQLYNGNKRLTATEAAVLARAEALRQVGRLPESVQEYKKLIALNPNLALAHQRLGLAAISDNNLWLAISELQAAAQLDKSDADTQNDLGLVYQQIGDYKSAKQSFLNAHKIAPKHLSASVNLANALANNGDFKSGLAVMKQAVNDHPESPLAHNNLGSLIARTNNQTEAAKEFAKAINLNPNLSAAHYGLGIALLKLKSYPAAAKEFQTAMTLNPGILDLQNKIDLANRCNLRSLAYTEHNLN